MRARAILAQQADISRVAAHAVLREEHVFCLEVLQNAKKTVKLSCRAAGNMASAGSSGPQSRI